MKARSLFLVVALGACDAASTAREAAPSNTPPPTAAPSTALPSPSASAPMNAAALLARIAQAESQRDTSAIPESARRHALVSIRARSARALARIADAAAIDRLRSSLSDDAPEVVAWAAYGLGYGCQGREESTVRTLVARAATLSTRSPDNSGDDPSRFALRPEHAIAMALARCGTPRAETTLVAWARAGSPRAHDALRGLAKLAQRGRLRDDTLVALLELATPDGPWRADALAPFAHVTSVDAPTEERLVEVARAALDAGGPGASAAVGALGAAGPRAAPLLREVLLAASAPTADRTEAARRLGRLGLPGQNELRQALPELMPKQPIERPPHPSAWFPLQTVLTALHPPTPGISTELDTLSHLEAPKDAGSSIRNLVTELRCEAAELLAGTASLSERLVGCDPDGGDVGQLAVLEVLGRGELTGKRAARWKSFATSKRPRVVARALSLLATHPEAPDVPEVLTAALGRSEPGVVATAAKLILDHPNLVAERAPGEPEDEPGRPNPKVMAALTAAIDRDRPPDQIHTRGMLLRAAARLGALSVKAKAEADCRVHNPTVRRHAELALTMLTGTGAHCPEPSLGATPDVASPGSEPIHLTFVTEAQRLGVTLEPSIAPESTARLVALAREGFFDGMPVHRVVPGRVVQLGDRTGGGYGGAGKPPLRCETSPVPFLPLSVGMALSGRDTSSSQLFVTLTSQPELDGDYPLVGYADLEWNDVVEGDVIRNVVVKD